MSALTANSSLQSIADILHAAMALGSSAWSNGGGDEPSRTPSASPSDLLRDLQDLFRLLRDRNLSYVLVGGVAMLRYVDGRNTEDIDLLLAPASLPAIPELVLTTQDRDFAHALFRSIGVDLLLTSNPLFKLVEAQYTTAHAFQEMQVSCATVEGLILLKLYALPSLYRQGNVQRVALYEADLMMLLHRYQPQVEPLFVELQPHVDPGALGELRRIVAEIQARIARTAKP